MAQIQPRLLKGYIKVIVERAEKLANADTFSLSDPYVKVLLDSVEIGRTPILDDNLNPVWNYVIERDIHGSFREIKFEVFDSDPLTDDPLGHTILRVVDLESGKSYVQNLVEVPGTEKSKLYFTIVYEESKGWGVIRSLTAYPLRKNCSLTLYQSTHFDDLDPIPPIYCEHLPKTPDGKSIRVNKPLWEDVYECILHAQHFVYITGWSIDTTCHLLRRRDITKDGCPPRMTVGELLKHKADKEGVTVLLLIWNDKTSGGIFGNTGVMNTHDEETVAYFKGSNVNCQAVYRQTNDIGGFGEFMFSHHQKTISLDVGTEGLDSKSRKVVSFIGGIDLTSGRWDTPSKSLFKSLTTDHAQDFYMPDPNLSATIGPRMPWQDIHAKVEGPAAWDILDNFVQRWKKQVPSVPTSTNTKANKKFLIDYESIPDLVKEPEETEKHGQEEWHVQVFRSIDFTSTATLGSNQVDRSIVEAYVNAIRVAERFIYIENQYFLGSSQYWVDDALRGEFCNNIIPDEIVRKIEEKIFNDEDFAVYIAKPLHPEGSPGDEAIQAILAWQKHTQEFMYTRIANAIKKVGRRKEPTDYLNFFCLGAREALPENYSPNIPTTISEFQKKVFNSRRYQIYIHSKMMIVDDTYIIVGSANINNRSLSGTRDTEIAIGAFQPHYVKERAYGQVHQFRMSLWAEHMNGSHDYHVNPENPRNVHKISDQAKSNWEKYSDDEVIDLPSHFLYYPLHVSADGSVREKRNQANFPDTNFKICGAPSGTLPAELTT